MRWPSRVLTAPSVGARIQRHSTAIASGAQIHGSTYSVRNNPVPGSRRASIAAASRPSDRLRGHDDHDEQRRDHQRVAEVANRSAPNANCPVRHSCNGPSRSQRCRLSQATTSIGSSRNATTPNRLGASSAYPSAVDRTRLSGHRAIKAGYSAVELRC